MNNSNNNETTMTIETPEGRVTGRRVWCALGALRPWERNPRRAHLRDIEGFAERLKAEGIRQELHVFPLNGELIIMQGHRRQAAGLMAGIEGAWCWEWPFTERQAFQHLLTLQMGTDEFDPCEIALAAQDALAVGIPKEELPRVLHRSEATVQTYLDLGTLPVRVQELVGERKIALETVPLLRQVEGALAQKQAALKIAEGALGNGEAMSAGAARHYLEQTYLLPVKWRRDWLVLETQLKRKYKLEDGHRYVEFDDRGAYVQGDVGLPETDYKSAEESIAGNLLAEGQGTMLWGELALKRGATIFVVAAPNRTGGFVRVVMPREIADAESGLPEGERVLRGRKRPVAPAAVEGRVAPLAVVGDGLEEGEEEELSDGGAVAERLLSDGLAEPRLNGPQGPSATVQPLPTSPASLIDEGVLLREVIVPVVEVLAGDSTKAMNDGAWRPLLPLMFEMATRSGMLPPGVVLEIHTLSAQHKVKSRAGLRWPLTLLLTAAAVRAEETGEPEALMLSLKALGVGGEVGDG